MHNTLQNLIRLLNLNAIFIVFLIKAPLVIKNKLAQKNFGKSDTPLRTPSGWKKYFEYSSKTSKWKKRMLKQIC